MSYRFSIGIRVALAASLLSTGLLPLDVSAFPPMREGAKATIVGDVYDSACYFTRHLDKPISHECAVQCAAGGSPLVIVTKEGEVYWPIDNKMPATGQNQRLVEFGGLKVRISGHVFDRKGSKAIVMDKIEQVK